MMFMMNPSPVVLHRPMFPSPPMRRRRRGLEEALFGHRFLTLGDNVGDQLVGNQLEAIEDLMDGMFFGMNRSPSRDVRRKIVHGSAPPRAQQAVQMAAGEVAEKQQKGLLRQKRKVCNTRPTSLFESALGRFDNEGIFSRSVLPQLERDDKGNGMWNVKLKCGVEIDDVKLKVDTHHRFITVEGRSQNTDANGCKRTYRFTESMSLPSDLDVRGVTARQEGEVLQISVAKLPSTPEVTKGDSNTRAIPITVTRQIKDKGPANNHGLQSDEAASVAVGSELAPTAAAAPEQGEPQSGGSPAK